MSGGRPRWHPFLPVRVGGFCVEYLMTVPDKPQRQTRIDPCEGGGELDQSGLVELEKIMAIVSSLSWQPDGDFRADSYRRRFLIRVIFGCCRM